jgi:hypothetical protein
VWSTYSDGFGWFTGNNPAMFGGVAPSVWGDGNGIAAQMSSDKEVLRTLFARKGYAGKNANVAADQWLAFSSTNSKHAAALFRIVNTTANPINWMVDVYTTAFAGWSELASIAVNGQNFYTGSSPALVQVALPIPPGQTSTVIFVSGSAQPFFIGNNTYARSLNLMFTNNTLQLPAGLQYVDDLDTASGGWNQ